MRWTLFILFYVLLAWYAFQAFKTVYPKPILLISIGVIWSVVVLNAFYQFFWNPDAGATMTTSKMYALSFMLSMIVFKLFVVVFLVSEDLYRSLHWGVTKLFSVDTAYIPSRRRFISMIALGIASLPFGALLYGMYKGKYNYKVLEYELEFDDLPSSFNGYKITHISDIHSGSFDDYDKVNYGVDLINAQHSDVIFFTGDLVNNESTEMEPWKSVFSKLSATDGVFSILGNHDYGDYRQWETQEAKEANFQRLLTIQKEMGFDLLLNEHRILQKGTDQIVVIGVENWGKGFKQNGDLKKASQGTSKDQFKILLSHDPSHWENEVYKSDHHYQLTLSGHTHGMQFGIEIPGWIKWSPVKWRYKYWAGIYKEMGRFINVNRGFGFLGYPGRFGIYPEITVITLKSSKFT